MGLLFGSGPCLASCGPVLISYLAGTRKNVLASTLSYLLFSSARIAVYLALGILVFFLGKITTERWLGGLSRYIFVFGGAFIILLGILTAFGRRLEFKACRFLEKKLIQQYNKSAILLGLIIGILPCAPLVVLLGYAGLVSRTWGQAAIYCFAFGLGTAVSPLLVLSVASGFISRFLQGKKEVPYSIFSFICGLVMVFLGALLIFRAR
jgi:sulfite exporter TauE/SafE